MSIRIVPAALFFALALAVTPTASPAQAQTKLRYAHVGVAGAPQTRYADELAALVKERTNGRIEIQVFANSQLGGVGEMVDGIKSGAIAMGHHDFASLGKICRWSRPSIRLSFIPTPIRPCGQRIRALRSFSRR